jgi:hypothetical protein
MHITNIWNKSKDVQKLKEISARSPFPTNLTMRAPEINSEVAPALGRFAILRDRKLKAMQALLVRTLVPISRIADAAMRPQELQRSETLNSALDAIGLLASANTQLTFMRREIVKNKLGPKCKNLATDADNSNFLLGEDLSSRIRVVNQSNALLRAQHQRERARFQPYDRVTLW